MVRSDEKTGGRPYNVSERTRRAPRECNWVRPLVHASRLVAMVRPVRLARGFHIPHSAFGISNYAGSGLESFS